MSIFLILLMMLLSPSRRDLVGSIEKMKGKVVADNQILRLCNKIANLSDNVKSLASTNERFTSELTIVKNVDSCFAK